MYCPSCGAELLQEMSYCNRCGASLKPVSGQAVVAPPQRWTGAAWAISAAVALITLGGFVLVFSVVMALVTRGIDLSKGGFALVSFALMVILAVDWMLIRQLSRVISKAETAGDSQQTRKQKAVAEKTPAQLAAPRTPASSVTDHTTRTFEPIHRARDSQQ
ncbi:MAG TPA: zinc ribbon domain-containing protein [Pyrinomonadaceae bacterium]